MPVFQLNQTITTDVNFIDVDELPSGDHTFTLVVEDDTGKQSDPDTVVVRVRNTRPTAVLGAPTDTVEEGDTFNLEGRSSVAVPPATLGQFHWTLEASEAPPPRTDL